MKIFFAEIVPGLRHEAAFHSFFIGLPSEPTCAGHHGHDGDEDQDFVREIFHKFLVCDFNMTNFSEGDIPETNRKRYGVLRFLPDSTENVVSLPTMSETAQQRGRSNVTLWHDVKWPG
jgi:hypothetical protein